MADMVAFPLRVSQRLKDQIGILAQTEGKKVGPFARELLAEGYEMRLVRLRQMGATVEPASSKSNEQETA